MWAAVCMSDYSYDRTAGVQFSEVLAKPAAADEAVGEAYRALVNFKLGLDSMHEIPSHLKAVYGQVGQAIDIATKLRAETHQLREMVKRLPR